MRLTFARSLCLRYLVVVSGAVLLFFSILIFSSVSAEAASILPDPADDNTGSEMKIVVSNANSARQNNLEAPVATIKLFIPLGQSGMLRIHGGANCNTGGDTWYATPAPLYGVDTLFQFLATDANENETTLIGSRNNAQVGCGAYDVPLGAAQTTPSSVPGHQGYAVILIRAVSGAPGSGNINGFVYQTLIPGSGLSYYAGSGNNFAIIERDGNMANNEHHNVTLRFAPDCGVTSAVNRELRWFDDDYLTSYQDSSDNYRTVLREFNLQGVLTNTTIILPRSGENAPGSAWVTIQPAHRYEWTWESVSEQNGVQFQLPYDSINFGRPCLNGNLDGLADGNGVDSDGNGITCELVGWAFDFAIPDTHLDIHVYFGGGAGSGAPGVAFTAEIGAPNVATGLGPAPSGPGKYQIQRRTDVSAAYPGARDWYGFKIPVPDAYKNTRAYVYAIGVGGTRHLLIGDVQTDCGPPPPTPRANCRISTSVSDSIEIEQRFSVTVTVDRRGMDTNEPAISNATAGLYFTETSGLNGMPSTSTNLDYGTVEPGYEGSTAPIQNVYTNTPGRYLLEAELRLPAGNVPCTSEVLYVGTKPYLKAFGGEVMAGGGFGESCTASQGGVYAWVNSDGGYKGASSQLTVTSLLEVNHFYSGSQRTNQPNQPKGLTIANTGPSEYGGESGQMQCVTNYFEDTEEQSIRAGVWGGSFGSGRRQYTRSGSLEINNLVVPVGSQTALFVEGDVFINGNGNGITYQTGAADWNEHPYFVLIAKGNVYISSTVTNIDGLIIAQPDDDGNRGTIYTCALNISGGITHVNAYDTCDSKLTIHGGLVANDIRFLRLNSSLRNASIGESPDSLNISELINYTPEMYLAPSPLRRSGSIPGGGVSNPDAAGRYDAIKSLPPIY